MDTPADCAGRRGVGRRIAPALGLLVALAFLPAAACRSGRGEPPPYRKLRPAVAYEVLRDSPETAVLDLRPEAEFHGPQGHIRGAYNIPEERLPFRLLEIGAWRDQTFLVYCGGSGCGDQGMAVLLSSGFRDAMLIVGGLEAWVADGFDVVHASEPESGARGKGEMR